jgi:DNA-binding NarL/FixJ family response regulator
VPARLVVVDDHPALLKGLAGLIGADPRYSVVATGKTSEEAVALAGALNPDVMILDLSMPGDVFVAIEEITTRAPETKLVVFTAYANVDLALRAFFAGAAAFVIKGQPAGSSLRRRSSAGASCAAFEIWRSGRPLPRLTSRPANANSSPR